jgi:hypothetical protein
MRHYYLDGGHLHVMTVLLACSSPFGLAVRILHLDPVPRQPGAIWRRQAFRPIRHACSKTVAPCWSVGSFNAMPSGGRFASRVLRSLRGRARS